MEKSVSGNAEGLCVAVGVAGMRALILAAAVA